LRGILARLSECRFPGRDRESILSQGRQNWISDIGIAGADVRHSQIVRKMAWTDDLYAIIEDEYPYGCGNKVITMYERVGKKFFKE
jgi:hypothetical protein